MVGYPITVAIFTYQPCAAVGRALWALARLPLTVYQYDLGHWDNLIWSWQIQFVLSTVFASVLLLIIVARGAELAPGPAAIAGGCLVALPLCGANGLVLAPALAAWLGHAAFRAWRGGRSERRTTALVLSVSVGIALAYTSSATSGPRGPRRVPVSVPPCRPALSSSRWPSARPPPPPGARRSR